MEVKIMKEEKIHEKKKQSFWSKNGFFAALAFCLIAVGIAAFGTIENLSEEKVRLNTTEGTTSNSLSAPKTQAREEYISTEPQEMTVAAPATEIEATEEQTEAAAAEIGYVMPIDNTVSVPFSNGTLIYSQTMNDYRVHNGIDIEAADGEEVKAFSSGEVTEVYDSALYGKTVVIDHGNELLSYYHGVSASVASGDSVKAGQLIGTVSEVKCEAADGSHIHFCIQKNGEWIDPQSMINS